MAFGQVPVEEQIQYGSSLTIQELTAAAGQYSSPRRLVLVGSALPFQGAEWAGENALTTTWYPGNAVEGTQQNLGPRELPSAWEGEWRRTLLGRTPVEFSDETGQTSRIVSPDVLRDSLEDMLRGGARLRVTWTVSGKTVDGNPKFGALREIHSQIVREGRAKSWRFPHDRHVDVRWNIEFHWVSRGGTSSKVASAREEADVSSISSGLEASVNATLQAIDNVTRTQPGLTDKAVPQATLGQLEQLASAPTRIVTAYARKLQSAVSTFKQAGNVAKTLASQPLHIANAAANLATNTVAVAATFSDQMGEIPIESSSNKSRPASLLRIARHLGLTSDAAALNAREAQAVKQKIDRAVRKFASVGPGSQRVNDTQTTRAGSVLAVYLVRFGDTPQRVSLRFYGTPDRAEDLLRANRLPTYTAVLRPGSVLFVPALAGTSARS